MTAGRQAMPIGTRPMIDRKFIATARRLRFTEAMAELCVEQGYRATTVADVVTRAHSSRNTVYEYFANKEEIFLALLDRAIPELFDRAEAACRSADAAPLAQVEATLAAILDWVAEHPAMAWACMVESTCATEESFQRHREAITNFTALLEGVMPVDRDRPRTVEESLVGGVATVLSQLIRTGETDRAPALLPDLSAALLAPYFVHRAASTP